MEERALLLTDVVDSTRLVEALGDQRAADVWAAHDRVARDLLGPHGGLEIDKTDGFLLLFSSVAQAAAYARAYHAGLVALSADLGVALAARAGLHFGPVVLRRNPPEDVARGAKPLEVEGIAKPTAARVMSVAGPGQTLLTPEARARLDHDTEVRSHGWWRMKGLEEPVELFEVGTDGAPPVDGAKVFRVVRDGSGWRPARDVPNNLPTVGDSFHGRRAELRAITAALDRAGGVVTVVGPGGTGKTRLGLELARRQLGEYPGGAWLVQLEEVRAADAMLAALANAVGIRLMGADPASFLAEMLCERGRMLLVLDNFEQLIEAGAPVLEGLTSRAPQVAWLVTSREALRIRGEQVVLLEALATPEPGASLEEVRDSDAVQLFVDRAVAAGPFALTEANAPHVAALVRLLDGIPLAIELAAARARMMPPDKLVARMSRRFDLLAGGRRGARPRQATLRGAIDWSWDLLSAAERLALAQCSCFRGGFTLEAAEAVLDLSAFDGAPWPMDAVQALMDKSLLRTWVPEDGGPQRIQLSDPLFGMYVSIHEYAAEKLRDPDAVVGPDGPATGPDAAQAARLRHAHHYAGAELPDGRPTAVELARLALERDNLTLAFDTALQVADVDLAARCWLPLALLGHMMGPASAVADRLARLDVDAIGDPALRERTLAMALAILTQVGRYDEHGRVAEALVSLRQAQGDVRGALRARVEAVSKELYSDRASCHARLGRLRREAEGLLSPEDLLELDHNLALSAPTVEERVTSLRRQAEGDDPRNIMAAYNLGVTLLGLGELDAARQTAEQVRQAGLDRGSRRLEMLGTNNLGQAWAMAEDWAHATPLLAVAVRLATELEERRFQFGGPAVVSTLADLEAGDVAGARARIDRILPVQRALGDPIEVAWALSAAAETRLAAGELDEARRLLEESDAMAPGLRDDRWHISHWLRRAWRRLGS